MNRIMTRRCFTAAAAAGAAVPLCSSGNTEGKKRVFILAGQSNCGGAGNGDLLPPACKEPDPRAMIFSKWTKNTWLPIAPYPRTEEKFKIEKSAFGPELGFGLEMRKAFPNDSVAIIKQAWGGTSVVAWEKNHGTAEYESLMTEAGHILDGKVMRDPQYPVLLKTIQDGLLQLDSPYEIGGFLWFQAEADTRTDHLAEQWAKRVVALLENLADDIGFSKDIPLFVMDSHFPSINDASQRHGQAIVSALMDYARTGESPSAEDLQRAAGLGQLSSAEFSEAFSAVTGKGPWFINHMQRISKMKRDIRALAADRPKTTVILVDDLPTYEGVHFNTEGQLEIGKRLLIAFKSMTLI